MISFCMSPIPNLKGLGCNLFWSFFKDGSAKSSGSWCNNKGQEHPSNTSNILEDYESTPAPAADSTSTTNQVFQFNTQGSDELIKGNQIQLIEAATTKENSTETTDQRKSDKQQILIEPTDQATFMDIHRCTLSRYDDVEGINGISTHGPSCHGPRTLLKVTKEGRKLELKVAHSTD